MKQSLLILFILAMVMPVQAASEGETHTMQSVRYVLGCMSDLGGLTDENLYTCSCRHDVIFSNMSFSDYEEGITYERNKAMPGEKGSFFRDNKRGEAFFEKLKEVRDIAGSQCIAVKQVVREVPKSK